MLSVAEAAVLVAVLAFALIRIRIRLTRIGEGLGTLGSALAGVETTHLRPLGQCIRDINAKLTRQPGNVSVTHAPDIDELVKKPGNAVPHVRRQNNWDC